MRDENGTAMRRAFAAEACPLPLPPRLYLASQSPRRRSLLREHGIEHEAGHPGVDDGLLTPGGVTPAQWVAALAYLKAAAGLDGLRARAAGRPEHRLVLGADTICVMDGRLIGQPADVGDARRILRLFEERTHEVLTGVALIDTGTGRRDLFVERAVVHVGTIGDERIEAYLAGGQWAGKAGAYNLTERLTAGWPIEFEGDETTIVGLPMRALLRRLGRAGGFNDGRGANRRLDFGVPV